MKVINVTKYLSYAFLGVLALLCLLIMLILSPLGVKTLVGFANDQDGVSIEDVSGSFYSQIKLGKFQYNNQGIKISAADALALEIGLNCVFDAKACVDNISARSLKVVLIENTQPVEPSQPLTDYIELPVAATLKRLSFDEISVYTQKIDAPEVLLTKLRGVNAVAYMYKNAVLNELSIRDVLVMLPEAAENQELATTNKAIPPTEHWIDALKNAQYTPIELPSVFVPINAEIQKLSITNLCMQPADTASPRLCTGQTQLSASLKNQAVKINATTKPIELIASNIDVKGSIDLANAFAHDLSLRVLPNAQFSSRSAEPLALTLKGSASATDLSLYSTKARDNILTLNAQFDVTNATLPLNIALEAKSYQGVLSAWFPKLSVPISGVTASVVGNTSAYDFSATANVDSEQASDITLAGSLSITNKDLRLSRLTTSGDIGTLNANLQATLLELDTRSQVLIKSELGFENLQLKPLVAQVDSQLNGNISINANVTSAQLWGSVNCSKVQGMLFGYKLSLLCDVTIDKAGLVQLKALSLTQGDNTITGNGRFQLPKGLYTNQLGAANNTRADENKWLEQTTTALSFDIDLVDLSTLYPSAKGTIVGEVEVTGQVNKPVIVATTSIEKLSFGDIGMQRGALNINIDAANNWQSDISIVSQEIWLESMLAEQVNVSLQGNLSSHTLKLRLAHPEYSLEHEFSGQVIVKDSDWRWQGRWDAGEFSTAFDTFTLDKPTNIRVTPSMASIRAHCWLSSSLTGVSTTAPLSAFANNSNKALCIDQLQYSQEQTQVSAKLAYNLNVPLLHYFPDIVRRGTSLPFTTDIELNHSVKTGVKLDAYSLMTQANITSTKHNIELVAVVANSRLNDQVLQTNVFAGTKSTGAIGLNSTLRLDPNNPQHEGQLSIDNFILSPLQRFIPNVEKLVGTLAGNILYDGPLTEPNLNGELRISDVELVASNYPYPLTNFNQIISISNKTADIRGGFELGSGKANYAGVLTLFDENKPFSFTGQLDGEGIQLALMGNEVIASPSLTIALDPNNFSLKGDLLIPRAEITIDKLPQSAKSPSSDTIIIGKVQEPPILPIGLDIDVRILIDPPKLKRVTINALDLTASLAGDLQVQVRQRQNQETNEFSPLETYVYGSVNVLSGSYEAYGQNLQIQKGAIFFSGAPSLPQFDITAVRNPLNTADNVVAGIRISGNPVVPKVELFSEPVMIQARQLSYLLQGTDISGGEGQAQDVMLVNMLVNFGVGNSENGVNRFGKSLGFDSLNVQTAGQGTNTQVQLTGRISDNVQVIYGVGLFDQATQVILRYQLLPQMYLEAKSGATSAVDVFYEWTTRVKALKSQQRSVDFNSVDYTR